MYKITEEYINKGIPSDSARCPIALCLRAKWDNTIAVSSRYIYSLTDFNSYLKAYDTEHLTMSKGLRSWISKFDNEDPVEEIEIVVKEDQVYLKEEINGNESY